MALPLIDWANMHSKVTRGQGGLSKHAVSTSLYAQATMVGRASIDLIEGYRRVCHRIHSACAEPSDNAGSGTGRRLNAGLHKCIDITHT